eukprot:3973592-Prymnesium_polylepis.1
MLLLSLRRPMHALACAWLATNPLLHERTRRSTAKGAAQLHAVAGVALSPDVRPRLSVAANRAAAPNGMKAPRGHDRAAAPS